MGRMCLLTGGLWFSRGRDEMGMDKPKYCSSVFHVVWLVGA